MFFLCIQESGQTHLLCYREPITPVYHPPIGQLPVFWHWCGLQYTTYDRDTPTLFYNTPPTIETRLLCFTIRHLR